LFVVLLVFLSLLLTAATVVYINKEDIQKKALADTKAQLDAKTQQAANADEQLRAVQANLQNATVEKNAQASAANSEIIKLQQEKASQGVELAKAVSQQASLQLDNSRLTEALNAAQAAGGKKDEEIVRLRGTNDTLVKQSSDLNSSVSDLTNKLEVTERERRHLAEQVSQVTGENERMSKVIQGAQLTPRAQETAVNRSGLPRINGVIRDVRSIAGSQYATISLGSADSVTRGMEFKVIDRAGNFLGTLTVDQVEPNESTGRLMGPNVAAIKPGVEVRTQL
jgi:chromosome segregation ATPase